MRLTATHLGCEHGVCGACTILLNGEPARACITLAIAIDGSEVRTLEGLQDDPLMGVLKARIPRQARTAVRLLHAGHADQQP